MRAPSRDDLLDAALASLAAGVHLAMAAVVDRFPPELGFSLVFVALPAAAAVLAALALLVGGRRPLQLAALYTWLMAVFTLPASGLGFAWVPTAALLTVALLRPRLSTAPAGSG